MALKQGLVARLIRSYGFVKKEMLGVARQPRLILTLVLAPFAILVIFGLGYRTEPPPFQTLLVLPTEDLELATAEETLSEAFGDSIDLRGTVTDATEARGRLRSGEIDLLIIAPAGAIDAVDEGEQAEFVIVHSEVDPIIRSSIRLISTVSVDELNSRALEETVAEAQTESQEIAEPLAETREEASVLVEALEEGDLAREREARERLRSGLDELEQRSDSSNDLYGSVAEALGTTREELFSSLRAELETTEPAADRLEEARRLEERLEMFESELERVQGIDPSVLVTPFTADVRDIADLPGTPSLFYAPGTLIVLLQHLAVTFAALSLVRERQLGLTELFQASPLAPGETLVGKYIAFSMMGIGVATVLTGAMFAFGVTMRGSFAYYAILVMLVILASLGLGFAISGLAQTDSQAVQYAMMLLLFSIFFTGLILPLDQLIPPVRAIAFIVPGTYGIAGLHDVMFRGLDPGRLITAGLAVYAVLAAFAAWWVVRRDVATFGR